MWEFTLDTSDLFVSENICKHRLFTYENFVVIVVVQLGWVAPFIALLGGVLTFHSHLQIANGAFFSSSSLYIVTFSAIIVLIPHLYQFGEQRKFQLQFSIWMTDVWLLTRVK